ncbi:MAG: response regulator [Ignavibacteriales bacterium]|nr:response regulator [Ignavibacteriales bacterium]
MKTYLLIANSLHFISKILFNIHCKKINLSKGVTFMRHNNVLIIDDEPELRNLIRRLLELEGFSVLIAGTSTEALEVLHKNEIDIVVSDARLPDKSDWWNYFQL